jgi:hypothetical protein
MCFEFMTHNLLKYLIGDVNDILELTFARMLGLGLSLIGLLAALNRKIEKLRVSFYMIYVYRSSGS